MRWGEITREPFRLFFPAGAVLGLFGVGHWLAYAVSGATAFNLYHSWTQIAGFMGCLIAGFLMTALPRFTSTATAASWEIAAWLGIILAQQAALALQFWLAGSLLFAAQVLVLGAFVWRRARAVMRRRASAPPSAPPVAVPPIEFVWIPVALLHGLAGSLLMALGQLDGTPAWLALAGKPMAQQGFLIGIILGVGGFMAPRLMGTFEVPFSGQTPDPAAARRVRLARLRIHLAAAAAFLGTFFVEGAGWARTAYALRAAVVTAELLWTTRCYQLPKLTDLYVRFVWLSIWCVCAGYWWAALQVRYRVAALHVTFIGGATLMALAVGSMVVLSHTGAAARLQGRMWSLRLIGASLLLAVCARLGADLAPQAFFPLLAAAALLWMAAIAVWLGLILPRLALRVNAGVLEREHEAAKRRVQASFKESGHSC